MKAITKALGIGVFLLIAAHSTVPESVYEYLGRLMFCVVFTVMLYFIMRRKEK